MGDLPAIVVNTSASEGACARVSSELMECTCVMQAHEAEAKLQVPDVRGLCQGPGALCGAER